MYKRFKNPPEDIKNGPQHTIKLILLHRFGEIEYGIELFFIKSYFNVK